MNFLRDIRAADRPRFVGSTYRVQQMILGEGWVLTVGTLACWIPAAYAARVEPSVALRAE